MSKKRENREDLCEEHPASDLGQILLAIAFLALWALDSFVLKFSTFPARYVPIYVRLPIAAALVALFMYFAVKSHRMIFDEVRKPPAVIKGGVFSYSRHPLYFSWILLYLGLAVSTFSLASFALWIVIFIFYDRISAYEEERLEERFGDEYSEYMNQVPRWLPRPGGFGKY
jgi:protein-S-isoprenylcysteine O-methyltransferase Ste14